MEGAQEGHFHCPFEGVIILLGVSLIEIGFVALRIGEEQKGDREGLEGLDEVVFPSVHLAQGEEEGGWVSRVEGSEKGTESGIGFFCRRPFASAQDDSRRVYQAQIDGAIISLVKSCKQFHGWFLLSDDLRRRLGIKDFLSFLFSGMVPRVSSFHGSRFGMGFSFTIGGYP